MRQSLGCFVFKCHSCATSDEHCLLSKGITSYQPHHRLIVLCCSPSLWNFQNGNWVPSFILNQITAKSATKEKLPNATNKNRQRLAEFNFDRLCSIVTLIKPTKFVSEDAAVFFITGSCCLKLGSICCKCDTQKSEVRLAFLATFKVPEQKLRRSCHWNHHSHSTHQVQWKRCTHQAAVRAVVVHPQMTARSGHSFVVHTGWQVVQLQSRSRHLKQIQVLALRRLFLSIFHVSFIRISSAVDHDHFQCDVLKGN